MKINILIILCLICVTLGAQQDKGVKSLRYQSALVRGGAQVQLFQQRLALMTKTKRSYLKEKFTVKKDEKKFKTLTERLAQLEDLMRKNYGMYPNINYTVISDRASVSLLLTNDQLEKLSKDRKEKKVGDKSNPLRTRYPVFKLENAKAIQAFMGDARKVLLRDSYKGEFDNMLACSSKNSFLTTNNTLII